MGDADLVQFVCAVRGVPLKPYVMGVRMQILVWESLVAVVELSGVEMLDGVA